MISAGAVQLAANYEKKNPNPCYLKTFIVVHNSFNTIFIPKRVKNPPSENNVYE